MNSLSSARRRSVLNASKSRSANLCNAALQAMLDVGDGAVVTYGEFASATRECRAAHWAGRPGGMSDVLRRVALLLREHHQVCAQRETRGSRWVTLRARWVTLRARWVTLRARWVTLRGCWVTVRARWMTLRARWVTLSTRGNPAGPRAPLPRHRPPRRGGAGLLPGVPRDPSPRPAALSGRGPLVTSPYQPPSTVE
jgi:hypothetical protein